MELGTVSAIIGVAFTLLAAGGGLLLRAFVNPIKSRTELNKTMINDHEERIRFLESQSAAHSIHLENLMKAVDRLVSKIDELVTYERSNFNKTNKSNGD